MEFDDGFVTATYNEQDANKATDLLILKFLNKLAYGIIKKNCQKTSLAFIIRHGMRERGATFQNNPMDRASV